MFDCTTMFRLRVKHKKDKLIKFADLVSSISSISASDEDQWIHWLVTTITSGPCNMRRKSKITEDSIKTPFDLVNYSTWFECYVFSFSVQTENTFDHCYVYECIKTFFNNQDCKVDIDVFSENPKTGEFINSTIAGSRNLRSGKFSCDYVIVHQPNQMVWERIFDIDDCIETLDRFSVISKSKLPFTTLESRKTFLEYFTDFRLYKYKEK